MKKLLVALLLLPFLFPNQVLAFKVGFDYGQVSSVEPTNIKPGSIITLHGSGFVDEAPDMCWEKNSTKKFPCTSEAAVQALKDVDPESFGGMHPYFQLSVLSVSDTEIKARLPVSITTGDGEYDIEYYRSNSDGSSGSYNSKWYRVTLTGSKVLPKPTLDPSPVITPTASASVDLFSSNAGDSGNHKPKSQAVSFFTNFWNWFRGLIHF